MLAQKSWERILSHRLDELGKVKGIILTSRHYMNKYPDFTLGLDGVENIDVDNLERREVILWAHLLQVKDFTDESEARKKIKMKLMKMKGGTTETLSGVITTNEYPYICSEEKRGERKVPKKTRLEHVQSLDVNIDNPFEHLGKNCPEPSCAGKVKSKNPIS